MDSRSNRNIVVFRLWKWKLHKNKKITKLGSCYPSSLIFTLIIELSMNNFISCKVTRRTLAFAISFYLFVFSSFEKHIVKDSKHCKYINPFYNYQNITWMWTAFTGNSLTQSNQWFNAKYRVSSVVRKSNPFLQFSVVNNIFLIVYMDMVPPLQFEVEMHS